MADPMKIRATMQGDKVEVKVLMNHEMETGQRKDANGATVPAHFIQTVTATCNDKTVLSAQWGTAVSKNPFLSFRFKGGKAGDKVVITWTDNKGESRTDESAIAPPGVTRTQRSMTASSAMPSLASKTLLLLILAAAAAPGVAQAPGGEDEIAKNRQLLEQDNPAELWEARGEGIWHAKRGPKQVSLERCDLGLGPGVVKGAYAQLPRYFSDTGKVEDLEARLVSCMMNLQGMTRAEAVSNHFGTPDKQSDMEALATFVAVQSKGMKMQVSLAHPKEQETYRLGEKIFYYRAGPHDFGCVTCHGAPDKRIRLQALPDLTTRRARRAHIRAGPRTASRRAKYAPCSNACTTVSANSAFRKSPTVPTPSPRSPCSWRKTPMAA
ncbi:MAG: sulfur oxidation c-type cytochrome SoxA [Rhodospirillales bacterium]